MLVIDIVVYKDHLTGGCPVKALGLTRRILLHAVDTVYFSRESVHEVGGCVDLVIVKIIPRTVNILGGNSKNKLLVAAV